MALRELKSEELSILDCFEENYADREFTPTSSGNYVAEEFIDDINLRSTWLNTPSLGGDFNGQDVGIGPDSPLSSALSPEPAGSNISWSDTESLTSSASAVASPALYFGEASAETRFGFLPDEQLRELSVKALNSRLKDLPKDIAKTMKKRRRTLKNRGYAHSCRIKRINEKSSLQTTKQQLESMIEHLRRENEGLVDERDQIRNRYNSLVNYLRQNVGMNQSNA